MSNKIKIILGISILLIAILVIVILQNKEIFYKEKIHMVAAEKPLQVEKTKVNEEILEEDEPEEIVLILSLDEDENINEELIDETLTETDEEINEELENEVQENEEENSEIQENQATENTQVTQPTEFYLAVNYGANVVNIYTKDTNGNYSVPYKVFTCSTGDATPTSGVYNIDYKYRWIALFGNVYGQYGTRIVGNILFHSVPYVENQNPASLEYWEYDKLRNFCIYGMCKINCRRCKMDI